MPASALATVTAVFPDRDSADSAYRLVTDHGYEAHEVDVIGDTVLRVRPHNADDAAAISERWRDLRARLVPA